MLKALADPTRWRIVTELIGQTLTVGDLTARVHATQYNVSKHLRVLREAGIVEMDKSGKHVHCRIAADFRGRLSQNPRRLDLGCCTFSFEPAARRR
jgi:DNA-binding transcriptional ArsR family regulator